MKIILTQEEIQDVLENHVNAQLTFAPGQSVSVDLVSDGGGFIAELSIRSKTTTKAKPQTTLRDAKPATRSVTKPKAETNIAEEPENSSEDDENEAEEAAENTEDTPETKPEQEESTDSADAEDGETSEDEDEKPEPKVATARKTQGKNSIFNFAPKK